MSTNRFFLSTRTLPRTFVLAGIGTVLAFGLAACKSNSAPAPIVDNSAAALNGPDPAEANMAGTGGQPVRVMGQSQSYAPQQQSEYYPAGQQAPAPIVQGQSYSTQGYDNGQASYQQGYGNGQANYQQGYTDGEAAEAATAPPPLPVYDQPPAPDPNDLWTPGYWDYGSDGYYWVPGAWVSAPYYGALWTPPYWGWYGGRYRFHRGYWGPHVGFYGGINYGFGYIGTGYYGGYWRGHDFYYNRAVNRLSPGVRTVYERPVVVNNVRYDIHPTVRISYNGGPGGINAQPRPFELAAEHERHVDALPAQRAMRQEAAGNRGNFFAANQGRPALAAFAHPPNAPANLAGNGAGFNRPGEAGRPGEFNRPGAPAPNMGMNRPGETGGHPGAPAAGFNRPGEPLGMANRPGAPAFNHPGEVAGRPGAPNSQPFNRPGEPAGVSNRPGSTNGQPLINRPGELAGHPEAPPAGSWNHAGAPRSSADFDRPAGVGNRPGGLGAPGNRPALEAPTNRPALSGPPEMNRPAPQPRFNQPGGGNGSFNRAAPEMNRPSAPAPTPRVDPAPRTVAPMPHVDMPRQAPAPRAEAPAPRMEAPRAAPAPHVEAPHAPAGPPAGGEGHPGGGGGRGPR